MDSNEQAKYLPKGAFFEIVRLETLNRITAIDPITGEEINFGYPKNVFEHDVKKLAMVRLANKIKTKFGPHNNPKFAGRGMVI